ncbi:site-specific integrase [Allosalinactinospora lopnorensis]|uniref:site-specific integrase n=1 Tax=Allosalinactinospora lopnorensis TaxID=1352348 RepID=UPI000696C38E|nr:site-specific integrase [Allosalinactinospora lopnorensis]
MTRGQDNRTSDGLPAEPTRYTVADAVYAWLKSGLRGRDSGTVDNYRMLAEKHIIPALGSYKLRELRADDVDGWLDDKSEELSTRTLRLLYSILNHAVKHAQARDKVKRNVVALCDVPEGKAAGRPSKALTLAQARALLAAAEEFRLYAYVVLSFLIGARTEGLRVLTWDHVELSGDTPYIAVWRSVRAGGDTKTRRSRRTLALPRRCVVALRVQRSRQVAERRAAGKAWQATDLVFTSKVGTELDAHNVRRDFRRVVKRAGLTPKEWTPRELRHSFVSLMSDSGVPLEDIARLVGHSGTSVTEAVYRKQIRPVITGGAEAMDGIFD